MRPDDRPQSVHPSMSIRTKLLVAVNAVLLVGLAVLLLADYQRGLHLRLREKQVAMSEEASLVLTAVTALQKDGAQAVQEYIDRACATMQDTVSPGPHIAVRLGDTVLQARTHHRASPAFARAMQKAAAADDHRAKVDGWPILVGTRRNESAETYVSEFTTNIRREARAQLMSRAVGIAIVGLTLTAIVNLILVRLVTRPIGRLARTVRQIGGGALGTAPPRFTTRELDFLAAELGEMSRSLAEMDRHRQQQMAKARRIQGNLLPRPDHLRAVGIHHVHLPAEDVGGDFFDVHVTDAHRTVVYMGDVTGHGVPAAMGAAMLKTLCEHNGADLSDPAATLRQINRRFHDVTLEGDFATMFMGAVDRTERRLTYASAGHEVGYLLRGDGRLDELNATGLPLGVDPDADYELVHLPIDAGDRLVLLTDGVVETMSPDGRLLGRRPIAQSLAANGNQGPQAIAARLLALVEVHRKGGTQLDDITLAVLAI